DPEAVGFEISRDGDLGRGEAAVALHAGNDLGGEEMGVDDDVPRLGGEQVGELVEVQLFKRQAEAVAAGMRAAGLVEQVIDVAEDVGGLVDEVEVGGAVEAAEGGVG